MLAGKPQAYFLYVPPDLDLSASLPIVVLCPQPGRNASDTLRRSGWQPFAERMGFLLAVPENDDVSLISALLEDIAKVYSLDRGRHYLVGGRTALSPIFAAAAFAADTPNVSPAATEIPRLTYSSEKSSVEEIWAFLDRHPRLTKKPVPTTLTVIVTGVRNDRGQVAAALYKGADGFPGDAKKANGAAQVPARMGNITLTFNRLMPDDYAVSLLHDEDNDGALTASLGFPLEGFGISTNPPVRFAPPKFAQARFYIAGDVSERLIRIRMTYLR